MDKRVKFEGIDISYTDSGKGRPVILLHGYLEAKTIWEPLCSIIEKKFRVVAIDLPGHGDSGVASESHTMEFMASAVRSVADLLGLKNIFMIGHSLGGYVTLAFLDLYPDLLAGYCLFHSHPNQDTSAALKNRRREIFVVRGGKKNIMYPENIAKMFALKNTETMKEAMARSRQIASRTSAEGIIAALNGMMERPSRKSLLERGVKPLLWILGRGDRYFSPETATALTRLPSNARIIVLENSGHLGFVEETALSAKIIIDFESGLSQLTSGEKTPD